MSTVDYAELSQTLKDQIDENSAIDGAADQKHRWHLGISEIGKECLRAVWYGFRWATAAQVPGRMVRLFATGHAYEERAFQALRRAGWTVIDRDPDTGKQWLYSAVHGHYGGSADAIATREGGPIQRVIVEVKTHHSKSFVHLVSPDKDGITRGVTGGKPQHYRQMCGYGYAFNVHDGLYYPTNKNDDAIAPQFVKLDFQLAKTMELRAESLIVAREPPVRISNKPTDYRCASCDHFGVCHTKAAPDVTCRSCSNARPTEGGEWACDYYSGAVIPREIVRTACPYYNRLF